MGACCSTNNGNTLPDQKNTGREKLMETKGGGYDNKPNMDPLNKESGEDNRSSMSRSTSYNSQSESRNSQSMSTETKAINRQKKQKKNAADAGLFSKVICRKTELTSQETE